MNRMSFFFQFFGAPNYVGFLHVSPQWEPASLIQTGSGVIRVWRFSCTWKGSKLGGRGREKKEVFFLSIEQQGPLQCSTVCEQSYVLWYHSAIMDGLCCPDLTGQWATSGCRWDAVRLPCIKKGWKIKLSMAIVDIFIPCLGIPMATKSCDPLAEVGSLHCSRVNFLPRNRTFSACNHAL